MDNTLHFETLHRLGRGTIHEMLENAYEAYRDIDSGALSEWENNWKEFDEFVFSLAEDNATFGFSTFLDRKAIGFSSWDPRQFPLAIIGHNCIMPIYRGKRYGIAQMKETICRLKEEGFEKAMVTTGESDFFLPAQAMYKCSGFIEVERGYGDKYSKFRTITLELSLKKKKDRQTSS